MRPKKPRKSDQDDFFKIRPDPLNNRRHELALLTESIDWNWIDGEVAPFFPIKADLERRRVS